MMTETEKLLHRVRAYLAQPGVSKAGLAVAAGLHKNALRDADRTEWNPTADTLRKVEPLLPNDVESSMGGSDTPGFAAGSPDNADKNIGRHGAEMEADSPRPFAPSSPICSPTTAPSLQLRASPASSIAGADAA